MVDPVTWGALVGVPVSYAFIYLEIGRYATPQVPRSLFDERKESFAYLAGLFVGIPLAFLFFLLATSLLFGGLIGTAISLVALVVLLEGAQRLIARSVYFGSDAALPFYVLGFRAGGGALLGLGGVAAVVANGAPTPLAFGAAVVEAVAFVLLLEAGGIQSTPIGPPGRRRPGATGQAAVLEGVGFLLLGLGPLGGPAGVAVASLAIAGGSAGLYLRRREVLEGIRPPAEPEPATEAAAPAGRYGRTDR